MSADLRALCLVVRVRGQLCAFPLQHVAEAMRPQPVQPVAGMPDFVIGVSVIRGVAVPVVDAGAVLGEQREPRAATRFVVVKADDRRVALAVDEVLGIRPLTDSGRAGMPPLLAGTRESIVSTLGLLDRELLLVLRSARMVPDHAWTSLAGEAHA